MTTATLTRPRKPRTPKPLAIALQAAPIAPCELFPSGMPGTLVIGATEYALSYHGELPERGEPVIHGYRLVKEDATSYDLPKDLTRCECMGGLRWGRCKHQSALRCLRLQGEIA